MVLRRAAEGVMRKKEGRTDLRSRMRSPGQEADSAEWHKIYELGGEAEKDVVWYAASHFFVKDHIRPATLMEGLAYMEMSPSERKRGGFFEVWEYLIRRDQNPRGRLVGGCGFGWTRVRHSILGPFVPVAPAYKLDRDYFSEDRNFIKKLPPNQLMRRYLGVFKKE